MSDDRTRLGGPAREPHRDYDPAVGAHRRINWEPSLATARRYEEPERWNGVLER